MTLDQKYSNQQKQIKKFATEVWGNSEKRAMDYVYSIDHYIRKFFIEYMNDDIGNVYEKSNSELYELYDRMEKDQAIKNIEIFKRGSIYRRAILCYISARDLYDNNIQHLTNIQRRTIIREVKHPEGEQSIITSVRYERNSTNRLKCIQYYGFKCYVCGFDFYKEYGERGKDFIEVHHIKPLFEDKVEHEINPIRDLRPVCSNCHSMLHRKKVCPNIETFKEYYRNIHKEKAI